MSLLFDTVIFLRNNASVLKILPLEQIVLIQIAGHIGNNKDTWVSQAILAQECNTTPRNIRRIIASLIEKKFITSELHGRKNRYSIIIQHRLCSSSIDKDISKEHRTSRAYVDDESRTSRAYVIPDRGHPEPISYVNVSHTALEPVSVPGKMTNRKGTIKANKQKIKETKKEIVELPSFLSAEQWQEYLDHRKSIKSPMTLLAQKKAINQLIKFEADGQDITEVLDQSIRNGWKGIFPVKILNGVKNGQIQQPQLSARAKSVHDYLARLNA